MSVQTARIAVTTTGSAGSATGTAYSARPVCGEVYAIRVDWHGDAPGTSDIVVSVEADANHPEVTLYDKDDANTDLWVYPQVQATDTAGAAIDGVYGRILATGRIKVVVEGCDALDPAATVTVYLKED